jgi:hypothetical protein
MAWAPTLFLVGVVPAGAACVAARSAALEAAGPTMAVAVTACGGRMFLAVLAAACARCVAARSAAQSELLPAVRRRPRERAWNGDHVLCTLGVCS